MPTSIRLSSEVEDRLNRLAMKTGRTKAFYLRRLIEDNLDDLEDAYLGQVAWEAFQANGAPAIPLDSLKRDLGLED